jgi:predicted phosphate transport protein (TIGR00153 family)
MIFWKRQNKIEKMVLEYLDEVSQCVEIFEKAMGEYFYRGLEGKFKKLVDETHSHESKADDSRRKIEYILYQKELIPESRGDILGLLEAMDSVPNRFESVLYQILLQDLIIPEDLILDIKELIKINIEAYRLLDKAVRSLFDRNLSTKDIVKAVDAKESQSDMVERKMTQAIFKKNMDTGDKLLLKELVLEIGNISDKTENVAERINIIAIKQQV